MKKVFLLIIVIFIVGQLFLPLTVSAMSLMDGVGPNCWVAGGDGGKGDCNVCDVVRVFYNVGKFIYMAMAGVAMIMILWAGFGLIVNFGNAEMVNQNKKLIFNTILAVLIIMVAYTLVGILMTEFLGVNTGQTEFWKSGKWFIGPDCK